MTHKVGVKGQVVIPKAIRDEIGIVPGDEVTFEPDGTDVRVRRVDDDPERRAADIKALRGIWAGKGGGTDELLTERRRERELEERKAQEVGRWSFSIAGRCSHTCRASRRQSGSKTAWLEEGATISSINLGEVLYILTRENGEESAVANVETVRKRLDLVEPDWPLVAEAARVKADGGSSYADAFCIATALRVDAPLWTGDPEIVEQADKHSCKVVDLRR